MSKEEVNNTGEGNCMYYAYSISLMYFLLKKRNQKLTETIFARLELSEKQQKQLIELLSDPTLSRFSSAQITHIIEPILGSATRRIASLQVKEELLQRPLRSSLLSVINYELTNLFRSELKKHALLTLTEDDSEKNAQLKLLYSAFNDEIGIPSLSEAEAYSQAELYKVFKVASFEQHVKKHYENILTTYHSEWRNQLENIYQNKLISLKRSVEEDYNEQQQFIKQLLADQQLNFLEVIKKFEPEWNSALKEIYETSDRTTSLQELAKKTHIQYQFLQTLLPKNKIQFQQAIHQFPQEWESYVNTLELEGVFTQDEIINNDHYQRQFLKRVQEKSTLTFKEVISSHEELWSLWVEKIYKEKQSSISKEALNNDPFYHKEFISTLLYGTALDFFTANNNTNIDKYVAHLNTDFQWGSEETLILLHDYLQGPRELADGPDKIKIEYDNEILLAIYKNGEPSSGSQLRYPDMILNNISNVHWISLVETDNVAEQLKKDYLTLCGFNYYLQRLEEKSNTLKKKSTTASDEAQRILQQLHNIKTQFTNPESTMTTEEFSKKCQDIIRKAPKEHLQQHRGIGKILNKLLNILIFIANTGINIRNLFYGKYELIDSNPIKTESIQYINSIEHSLQALKTIRLRDTKKLLASSNQNQSTALAKNEHKGLFKHNPKETEKKLLLNCFRSLNENSVKSLEGSTDINCDAKINNKDVFLIQNILETLEIQSYTKRLDHLTTAIALETRLDSLAIKLDEYYNTTDFSNTLKEKVHREIESQAGPYYLM